jgi:hypothetical protein
VQVHDVRTEEEMEEIAPSAGSFVEAKAGIIGLSV